MSSTELVRLRDAVWGQGDPWDGHFCYWCENEHTKPHKPDCVWLAENNRRNKGNQ